MFVAVMPCKGRFTDIKEKVLIMDTEDLSVEFVDRKVLDAYYAFIVEQNLQKKMFSGMSDVDYVYKHNGLYMAMITGVKPDNNGVRVSGSVKLGDGGLWFLDGLAVRLWYSVGKLFTVNNTVVGNTQKVALFAPDLHYAFKFRDFIVLRFICAPDNWQRDRLMFTCVVTRRGTVVSAYAENILMYGDRSVMTQIELITEY